MFQLWLTLRLFQKGRMFNWTTLLSLIGIVVGVAALVITMSVLSGVETLLRRAVIDVSGHLVLMKPGGDVNPLKNVLPKIKEAVPSVVSATPFVHLEAVLARKGKITGVILQGIDTNTVDEVLNLRSRLVSGDFNLNPVEGVDSCLIGKELARKNGLGLGDEFQVVLPKPSTTDTTSFHPISLKFRVAGILDLGKYDYNERILIVSDLAAQNLAGIGNVYSGMRIRLKSEDDTKEAGYQITTALGHPYWIRDWYEMNYNFFSALAYERWVIFIVMLFMILVASFNISSTLFVSVLKRYQEVSILKTLGARKSQLVRFFVIQGVVLGFIGSVVGLLVGVALAKWVSHAAWVEIPAEVYKFDHLPVEFRFFDISMILMATFLVCFISTLIPALRGAKLNPVEGLRYE